MTTARIVPTSAFRHRVHARRNEPLAASSRKKVAAIALPEMWKKFEALRGFWLRGVKRAEGPFAELMAEAFAFLDGGQWPSGVAEVERLAAAERMLNGSASIVGAVASRLGAETALRVKAQSMSYGIRTGREGGESFWALGAADLAGPGYFESGWVTLRSAMCAADEASYVVARDLASTLRENASPLVRVMIAFAFPGEPAWANEDLAAANTAPDFTRHVHARSALLASSNDEAVCATFVGLCQPWGTSSAMGFACDMVLGLGIDAGARVLLAELTRALAQRTRALALDTMAAALTSLQTEPVADALAPLLRHPVLGRYVATYFEHSPELAQRALAPLAEHKSLLGDAARHILAAFRAQVTYDAAAAVMAPEEEWPSVVRDAPWRARWSAPPIVFALPALPYAESIVWAAGEREEIVRAARDRPAPGPGGGKLLPMTDVQLAQLAAQPRANVYADLWMKWEAGGKWLYYELPEALALELWTDPVTHLQREKPITMLARFGEAGLAGLFARDPFGEAPAELFEAYLRVDSPRAAEACARALVRRKAWAAGATRWLLARADAATTGLVPVALRDGKNRLEAQRALLLIASNGMRDRVLGVAAQWSEEARAAIAGLLDEDPLSHIDEGRAPYPFLRPEALPSLRVHNGKALPAEAVGRVLEILRGLRAELPYPGVPLLRDALSAESASAFAWALFQTWDLHGRRRADVWMARSLVAFPSEQTGARLLPHAREWAQRDSSACVTVFEIMMAIGTPNAALHIATIADESGLDVLSAAAKRLLGEEASRDDRVPTLGLDASGRVQFDLGSRTVTFSLDETLRPALWLEDGRRLAQLPRPSKEDNPELAARALEAWKALGRDAAVIAQTQPRRFERAMVQGRRFSRGELEAIARHPVLGHLARRVVWGVFAGERLEATFRVVDDGSFTDDDDRPCDVATTAVAGIIHPILLDDDTRARWASLFADYEILQPFEQLARDVLRPDAGVAAGAAIRMTTDLVAAPALVSLFDARGWKRPMTGFVRAGWRVLRLAHAPTAAREVRATLLFTPGTALAQLAHAPPQKLGEVKLSGTKAFADVAAIEMSELLRDIAPWRAYP